MFNNPILMIKYKINGLIYLHYNNKHKTGIAKTTMDKINHY